jgi:hypothetical protein
MLNSLFVALGNVHDRLLALRRTVERPDPSADRTPRAAERVNLAYMSKVDAGNANCRVWDGAPRGRPCRPEILLDCRRQEVVHRRARCVAVRPLGGAMPIASEPSPTRTFADVAQAYLEPTAELIVLRDISFFAVARMTNGRTMPRPLRQRLLRIARP